MEWEYRTEKTPDLEALGREGWELAAFKSTGEAVLKRPMPAAERFTREQAEHVVKHGATLGKLPTLLNPQLAALVRQIGHTQMLIVCDRGFPLQRDLPLGVVDISVTSDVPTFPRY